MNAKKVLVFGFAFLFLVFASCNHNANNETPETVMDKTQAVAVYEIKSTETTEDAEPVVKNVMEYSSIDCAGNPITLSGYFEYSADSEINQIILMEHGTITFNTQAPSVAKSNQNVPASKAKGRVVICPDYLGYGSTVDKVHPYVNAEMTAINSIDMELAVMKYFADNNITVKDTHYTVVAGYSQGGSSALAVHKYMEQNLSAEKQALINLNRSFCGGTPADLKATMDVYFNAEKTNTALVFFVIQSMLESYPDVLEGYTLQDFYTDKVDAEQVAAGFGTKDTMGVYAATLAFPADTSAANIHSADMHNPESDLYKKFVGCLEKNNLTDWEPKHPINFYHSTTDDTVPIENYYALMAEDKMGRYPDLVKGETGEGTHGGYAGTGFYPPFLLAITTM